MIFDKFENIENYLEIPDDVKVFVKKLSTDMPAGRQFINDNCYANIDEYATKPAERCRLEAHKKYIDIQLLLSGKEELQFTDIEGLKISEEYDENRDVMFFAGSERKLNSVILSEGYFALLYPHEAHQPQMNYGCESLKVKKVVIKIKA